MRKELFLIFVVLFSLSFASVLVIYQDAALFESTCKVDKSTTIYLPQNVIIDSFYVNPPLNVNFFPANKLTLQSILSANKFITLNGEKYEVISISPLVLKKNNRYFYNLDIKGFEFEKLPEQTNPGLILTSKSATMAAYEYLFHGLSYRLQYFFDEGRINCFLTITNKTNYEFKNAFVYIATQNVRNYVQHNELRLMSQADKSLSSPQKMGENYIYKVGKKNIELNSNVKIPFYSGKVDYTTYYAYYPTSTLSKLKAVLTFESPVAFPSGEWVVLSKTDKVNLLSGGVKLPDFSKGEEVTLQYTTSYDLKGIETIKKTFRKDKNVYKVFNDKIFNYTDHDVTVKIYKEARNASLYEYSGHSERIGNFIVFTLKLKPKSRGEISYTLKYSYY